MKKSFHLSVECKEDINCQILYGLKSIPLSVYQMSKLWEAFLIKSEDTWEVLLARTAGNMLSAGPGDRPQRALKNVSDNILKSLQNFTAKKEKYVDLAYSQWEDELHSFVQLEGVNLPSGKTS